MTLMLVSDDWSASACVTRQSRCRLQRTQTLQPDLASSLAALQATAGHALDALAHLAVCGRGWRLTPALGPCLADLLPALTHLDLAPESGDYSDAALEATALDGCGGCTSPARGAPPFACLRRGGSANRHGPMTGLIGSVMDTRCQSSGTAADDWPQLDLAAAQALVAASLPNLRHLSAALRIVDSDAIAAWSALLCSLPPGLRSLRLHGPLCHCPELAAAAAGWAERLPVLRRLALQLGECQHSHPDMAAQLYEDPEAWTDSCWHGVFPALTQLRSLELSTDSVTQGHWRDACACSGLTRLRLHQSGWSSECDGAGLGRLTQLRDLALTLGDSEELRELSRLTNLTRLELHLLGLMDYGAGAGSSSSSSPASDSPPTEGPCEGLLHIVTRGLRSLQRLHLSCRSARVNTSHLACLARHCPALRSLELRAPLEDCPPAAGGDSAAGACAGACEGERLACCLPPQLCALCLENACAPSASGGRPEVKLACLPPSLTHLRLRGVALQVHCDTAAAPHNSQQRTEDEHPRGSNTRDPARGVAFPAGPRTLEISLQDCTLLGGCLGRLLGPALRALDVIGCNGDTSHGVGLAMGGSGVCSRPGDHLRSGSNEGAALGALMRCRALQRLRLWGCRGLFPAFNDAALQAAVSRHPALTDLAVDATAVTPTGIADALPRAPDLRSLELVVSGQECAAALVPALAGSVSLERLGVVLPTGSLGFVADCLHDHLARGLPGVRVVLRTRQGSD